MKSRLIPFAILTAASLLTGYITGNNIFYIFFATLMFVALLAIISLIISYAQVNYLQKVTPDAGVKGETINLDMQIHNDFFVPLPLIEIEYDLPDDDLNLFRSKTELGVLNEDMVSIQHEVFCKYRGKWQVGINKVKIYDIFGLFRVTLDFYSNSNYRTQTLIIKPRIVPLDYLPLPYKENVSSQNPMQKNTFDTAEISDIRKYVFGDILKKIHWKLSMSKQELLVKNHSLSFDPDTYIYLDSSSHGLDGLEAIEIEDMVVECATAVSSYLLNLNLPSKFIVIGKDRTELYGGSPEDFPAIYESMTDLVFEYDFSFFDLFSEELSAISHANSIFIITHTLNAKAFDSLIYLREASINITILLIEHSGSHNEERSKTMLSELASVGVSIIHIAPGDDLNQKIKEHANE